MTTLQKILYLLDEKQLTATELAEKLKINNSSVTDWKKGKTKSYNKYINEIAKILGVSKEYLLCEDEIPLIQNSSNETPTQRIFKIIKERNIKQKTLSEIINVPYSTLNRWFKSNKRISKQYIENICKFLNLDIDYILTGNNTNNTEEDDTIKDPYEEKEISNKIDENIILEIYRMLTENEKHKFMDFVYRMKFYHQENLAEDESKSKLENLNLTDNQKFLA